MVAKLYARMGTLSVLAYFGGGAAIVWLLRAALRGRRTSRTEITPVSEQWLAERRGKRTPD